MSSRSNTNISGFDGDGWLELHCAACYDHVDGVTICTVGGAIAQMRRFGWHKVGGKWYGPGCYERGTYIDQHGKETPLQELLQ